MTPAPLVFLVDDDPAVCKALMRLIGVAGYAVEAFDAPGEFLARAPHPGPTCLVPSWGPPRRPSRSTGAE